MSKGRIIFRVDGGVTIISPGPNSRRWGIDVDELRTRLPLICKLFSDKKAVIYALKNKIHIPKVYEPEAEWLNRVFTKAMKYDEDCEYDDVDESEIPKDRKYRNAWTGSKGHGISIDDVKKAEIDSIPVYTEKQEKQIQAKMRDIARKELGI